MDETYIGGQPRKGSNKDDDGNLISKRGRGTKKAPVIGAVERNGSVKAKAVKKIKWRARIQELLQSIAQILKMPFL